VDTPAEVTPAAVASDDRLVQHLNLQRRMLFGIEVTLLALVLLLGGVGAIGIAVGIIGLAITLLAL
jgi:hypothetical protein